MPRQTASVLDGKQTLSTAAQCSRSTQLSILLHILYICVSFGLSFQRQKENRGKRISEFFIKFVTFVVEGKYQNDRAPFFVLFYYF